MKKIRVEEPQVLENLNRFRAFLRARAPSKKRQARQRVYPMWIDCKSGQIEFTKKKRGVTTQKQLQLIVHESKKEGLYFEIGGHWEKVELAVRTIAEETIEVLNLLALFLAQELPEKEVLENLFHIELASSQDRIEQCPGWQGSLTRLEAEKKLQGKPVGSYLFRQSDDITQWMLKQYLRPCKGYLLTVVEKEAKISDYLILKTQEGWALHKDDPDLSCYHFYPTFSSLFHRIDHIAQTPCA